MVNPHQSPVEPSPPHLGAVGLDVCGTADPAAWDCFASPSRHSTVLLPGTQAILVYGSGGPTLWRRFLADLEASPHHLTEEPDPLDAYVRRAVAAADAAWSASVPRRWFFAAPDEPTPLDFRLLAHLAGLGGKSRLGLLLHPRFGPWLGLRAACFVAAPLPLDAPIDADPCAGCPAPCITACPGQAFVAGQWSVARCSAFHAESSACDSGCAARQACPAGADQRYDPEAIVYHYNRKLGRAQLRHRLGIAPADDCYAGEGPHWDDWKARVDVNGAARR